MLFFHCREAGRCELETTNRIPHLISMCNSNNAIGLLDSAPPRSAPIEAQPNFNRHTLITHFKELLGVLYT